MKPTLANIMKKNVVTLPPTATLHDAHTITKQQGIRHIPIVNDDYKVVGIVTQKALIANVMQILSDFGERAIERKEKHTDIMNVAESDFDTVTVDRSLADVAEFFIMNKHGCLPVVDNNDRLIGIVTSSDFVRLAADLLRNQD